MLNFLEEGNKLPEMECSRIVSQVLDALQYCHEMGVCHRDIKLANILIQKNKTVKIIDFGLSEKY